MTTPATARSTSFSLREPTYDYPAKNRYRRQVWDFADQALADVPVSERRVAYLDSGQALETLFLLRGGYRASNIRCVNTSPAVQAHITMKLKGIREAQGLVRSTANIFDDVRNTSGTGQSVNVLHADLCQQITPSLLTTLATVASSPAKPDVVIVNTFCHREQWSALPPLSADLLNWAGRFEDGRPVEERNDRIRVSTLLGALAAKGRHTVSRIRLGRYVSHGVKQRNGTQMGMRMLWVAVAYKTFRSNGARDD